MSTDIGCLQDFPDGQVSVVAVGRAEIGVIRWHENVYAISTVCTHQGGPICRGVLADRLTGREPGDMTLQDSAPVIACPWHGWEFDVSTGEAIWDPAIRIRTYLVEVVSGRILVDTSAAAGR